MKWGINIAQSAQDSNAQYFLNAFHQSPFWQLSTTNSGSGWTKNEVLLNIDSQGNPTSLSTGWDGSSLGVNVFANTYLYENQGSYLYPGGTNSWTLQFSGRGTFVFFRDITTSSSGSLTTSTSGTTVTVPTPTGLGMGVALSATGFSSAATFSGTTVTMTGSSFTADTPVSFLNSGGSLPSPLTSMNADGTATVYYVLAAGLTANTFSIATTKGGTAITFSGGSGTHTGYGDWARSIALVRTTYLSRYNAGEIWNPDYVSKFSNVGCVRFMQMMEAYQNYILGSAVTFTSGSPGTINWTGHGLRPGQSVTVQPANNTSALPAAVTANTTYFVLRSGYTANSFQIASTQGGTAINFATAGTGTFNAYGNCVMASSDLYPSDWLFVAPTYVSYQGKGAGGGATVEDMVDLCYRLGGASGCDMWINYHPLSDTSVATALAQRIYAKRAALGCSFKIYTEHNNETWLQSTVQTGFYQRARELFPSVPNVNDGTYQYGLYAGIQSNNAFRTAWTGAGGSAADHIRVFGGQNGNPAYAFDGTQGLLFRLATYNGGSSSYWTGVAGNHFDAYATAPYMNAGEQLPDSWTADSDAGIAKAYTEYNAGGLLKTSSSTATTTGGTASAFTVTIAGATATNQQIINVTLHTSPNASATLSLNGGAAVPLADRIGNNIGSAGLGGTVSLCYTDTVATFDSAGNKTGNTSVTAKWRNQPYGYAGGYMQGGGITWTGADLSGMNTFNTTYGTSLYLIGYEGGQTMSNFGNTDNVQWGLIYLFNNSSQMGQLYTTYMPAIQSAGQSTLFCHYADIKVDGGSQQNYFGLLESIMQTSTPKYASYMALVSPAVTHKGGKKLGKF